MSATTSQLAVANTALALLKNVDGITAISAGASDTPEQKYCYRFFEPARLCVLRAHDWPFARKRLCVAAAYDPGTARYGVPIPSDCVRILSFLDAAGRQIAYEREGATALLREEPDQMLYSSDVTDIDLWDPLARDALVNRLASDLAEPVTGREDAWQKHMRQYDAILLQAKIAAGREMHRHYGRDRSGSRSYPETMLAQPSGSRPDATRSIPETT